MTFLLYIGKNKDFLRKFSKLENVQMIYAQNYQDAITICIRLKVRENIIVLHEQGEMNGDIEQDRKSTRLNSSHSGESRMPSSA